MPSMWTAIAARARRRRQARIRNQQRWTQTARVRSGLTRPPPSSSPLPPLWLWDRSAPTHAPWSAVSSATARIATLGSPYRWRRRSRGARRRAGPHSSDSVVRAQSWPRLASPSASAASATRSCESHPSSCQTRPTSLTRRTRRQRLSFMMSNVDESVCGRPQRPNC